MMDIVKRAFAVAIVLALTPFAGRAQPQGAPANGDPRKGQALFEQCAACHGTGAEANMLGPTLKGLFGRKAAALESYNYSPAMKRSGVVWNAQTLDAFLADPQALIPGTKMPFAGMPLAAERADLIGYLQQAGG